MIRSFALDYRNVIKKCLEFGVFHSGACRPIMIKKKKKLKWFIVLTECGDG